MILEEAYERCVEKIGTPDDTSGRAVNPQCTNAVLLRELLDQMRSYANITKGIQDIFSYPLDRNMATIPGPTLALRSEAYRSGYIIVNGTKFPVDFRGPRDVDPNFITSPIYGIPNWIMPYNEGSAPYLGIYPMIGSNAQTTTLTAGVSSSDTTLPVASTAGFPHNFGRITIGSEVILYQYTSSTSFIGCIRGVEMSTAASHSLADAVSHNNLVLQYSRLPVSFAAESDDSISAATLAQILEPCDEHMEGIIKMTTYNRLLKIDVSRADLYKGDSIILYGQYEKDIAKGRAKKMQTNVRGMNLINESGLPYGTNLVY